jgi:thiol-disulfide isomerase/thioredoxin
MPVCVYMRINLAVFIVGIFIAATAATAEQRVAPDWTLSTPAGEPVTLSDVAAERPVLLLFWATWCPYCKALMPHLQSIDLEYGDEIEILAIHFRDDKGDPVGFVRDAGYNFTLLTDGNAVAELNGIWSTPGVLIVDTERAVRFDLYAVPTPELPESDAESSHRRKAGYLAPFWAAEIRKRLDTVLADSRD